jgi:putative ABC transport system permease protein
LILIIVSVGVLLGIGWGAVLGHDITNMYAEFYRFPMIYFQLDLRVVIGGILLCVLFAVGGTLRTVFQAARLPPAEAMRPEPPARFRATLMERFGLQALLSPTGRMILRQLERKPVKAAMSIVGIALSAAVLVLGRFSIDAIDFMIEYQFEIQQRHDITVTLVEETHYGAFYELNNLPGVIHAEPFRSVPVRLRHRSLEKELVLQGIDPDGELVRLINSDSRVVPMPPDGLIISEMLAKILQVEPGDTVQIEVLDGKRQKDELLVTGTISDFAGTNAYLSIDALRTFLQEGPSLSGAYLQVDDNQLDTLYGQLKETPRVAGVSVLEAARTSFMETFAENILKMNFFNILFACVIAVGVVYNTARISLSERARELATLRVIGFTRAEVSFILLGELAVLTLAAIPLGLAIGYGFAALLARSLETEMYRIPLVIEPWTFGFAASVVMISALVSGLIVRRKVDHFDLIAVLKSRD